MLAGLSPLLPDGTVTSFVIQGRTSDVTLKDGAISGGGTPTSVGARGKLDVPVAVLTSSTTASSGEQTLLAFRGLDDVRVFGAPTRGYASVNQEYPLYTGRTMVLTTGISQARTAITRPRSGPSRTARCHGPARALTADSAAACPDECRCSKEEPGSERSG